MTSNATVSIFNLISDGSALIHVQKNQTFYINYRPEMTRRSISRINYKVDKKGTLYFPTDVVIMGHKTPTVTLFGTLYGALNLTVAEGRVVHFDPNAKTEPPPSKNFSNPDLVVRKGIEMGIWTQQAGSKLIFTGTGDCNIRTSDFVLKSGASLEAKVNIFDHQVIHLLYSLSIYLLTTNNLNELMQEGTAEPHA